MLAFHFRWSDDFPLFASGGIVEFDLKSALLLEARPISDSVVWILDSDATGFTKLTDEVNTSILFTFISY